MIKKNLGFLVIATVSIILVLLFVFKDKTDIIEKKSGKKAAIVKKNRKVKKINFRRDVIKEVKIFYNIIPSRLVRVRPFEKPWALSKSFSYDYEWNVNGDEIENNKMSLSSEFIKKGDEIYCVIIPEKNDEIYESMKSETIKIKNAPPIIKYRSRPVKDDFGNIVYTINAVDIDGDKLTYSLIKPLDGMTIDISTGEINWYRNLNDLSPKIDSPGNGPRSTPISSSENIEENFRKDISTPKQKDDNLSTGEVTIRFKVVDTDGAEAIGSIIINTATGSEVER